jgi:hypothetical protein
MSIGNQAIILHFRILPSRKSRVKLKGFFPAVKKLALQRNPPRCNALGRFLGMRCKAVLQRILPFCNETALPARELPGK